MGEPLIVARPFVSLFGGVQPAMLMELGGGSEDGLMDRFLFAYPKARHVRFSFEEISEGAEVRYASLYTKLADLPLATDEHGDPNPKPLTLPPEAKKLFARTVDSMGTEMLQPGFPGRLEGVWSKLRGHLARLSLVLAVCRCAEALPGAREERVEAEDVEAASRLLAYFKAHARRVYAELSAPDSLDLLAGELRDLLEESGGRWEGSATDLHAALAERGTANLPERPEELSKLTLRIGERSPALKVSQGWRKVGGRGGRSFRVIKLSLAEKPSENAVGPAVTVDPQPTVQPRDNGTNGNNGDSVALSSGGDNGDYGNNGDSLREPNRVASANNSESSDGRSRFTV
jgi:hypothetical protein